MTLLRHRPLRVKLSLLMVVLLSAGLIVSSFIATAALSGYLIDRVDEAMTRGAGPFSEFKPPVFPNDTEAPRPPARFYIEVVYADGRAPVVLANPDSTSGVTPDLPASSELTRLEGQPFTVGSDGGSEEWRVLVTSASGQDGWVVVASSLADVQATVQRLTLLQLIVGVIVVLVAALVGYVVVRRSLKPLNDISDVSRDIAEGDLSLRVPVAGSSSEVDQLASSFNTMVDRIETSFAAQQESESQARASEGRMRRFIADAGHELRTPLTSIRGYAELIEQGAAADPALAVSRIQAEADRMGGLVDDLQLLARLDEQRPMRLEAVDMADVCAAAVAAVEVIDPDRVMTVQPVDGPTLVQGDEDRLRQVMDNLLSNAIRYSPGGSPIDVVIDAPDDVASAILRVRVIDRGPGLSPEDAERVFDRLYRTDEARSRVDGGSGLGLAIVRSIVEAHGGVAFVESDPGSGSTFGFTLPAATRIS